MDLGYARVSTVKQNLDRKVDALTAAGIPAERVYLDKKSGATTDRPGLRSVLGYARDGDVCRGAHLGPAGPHGPDTLNLIHELAERGVGVRNLSDPIMQRGEFITDAAAGAGTYRKKGARWLVAEGRGAPAPRPAPAGQMPVVR